MGKPQYFGLGESSHAFRRVWAHGKALVKTWPGHKCESVTPLEMVIYLCKGVKQKST